MYTMYMPSNLSVNRQVNSRMDTHWIHKNAMECGRREGEWGEVVLIFMQATFVVAHLTFSSDSLLVSSSRQLRGASLLCFWLSQSRLASDTTASTRPSSLAESRTAAERSVYAPDTRPPFRPPPHNSAHYRVWDMEPAEVEFLAEKELIKIVPNFSENKLYLISVCASHK